MFEGGKLLHEGIGEQALMKLSSALSGVLFRECIFRSNEVIDR